VSNPLEFFFFFKKKKKNYYLCLLQTKINRALAFVHQAHPDQPFHMVRQKKLKIKKKTSQNTNKKQKKIAKTRKKPKKINEITNPQIENDANGETILSPIIVSIPTLEDIPYFVKCSELVDILPSNIADVDMQQENILPISDNPNETENENEEFVSPFSGDVKITNSTFKSLALNFEINDYPKVK
ncbi:hypothetical protein RFI_28977, partial [Reticulomyxa filosa]